MRRRDRAAAMVAAATKPKVLPARERPLAIVRAADSLQDQSTYNADPLGRFGRDRLEASAHFSQI